MDELTTLESNAIERSPTAPPSFSVNVKGFESEERAKQFGELLGEYVREFSCHFDLSQLDGVTVAYDYHQALLDLDRGYKSSCQLSPSKGHVVGVAMTPSVMRGSSLKSHIVLNAAYLPALENAGSEHFGFAMHLLAHECAHVEITHRFNSVFPGVLLQKSNKNLHEAFRWDIILACWDEYAATLLSARYGPAQTEAYEDTFLQSLDQARQKANGLIAAYRIHGSVNQIIAEVYGVYGELLKFAAYHLGNMNGRGLTLEDTPRTAEALVGHWFAPYFEQLDAACKGIASNYGEWANKAAFEVIGDLADEIVGEGGVCITTLADDQLYVDIPFSPETMPDGTANCDQA